MHVNGARLAAELIAPDIIQQLVTRKDNARMQQQKLQQLVLLKRQHDLLATHAHLMLQLMHLQRTAADKTIVRFRRLLRRAAAQHSLNACHHLQHAKGLGDVVISTTVKSLHLIILRALRRRHNHRNRRIALVCTQTRQNAHAVLIRQHNIQHNQLRDMLLQQRKQLLAARTALCLHAHGLQCIYLKLTDILLILNANNHDHHLILFIALIISKNQENVL